MQEAKKRNINGRKQEELLIVSCTGKKKLRDWKNWIRELESREKKGGGRGASIPYD